MLQKLFTHPDCAFDTIVPLFAKIGSEGEVYRVLFQLHSFDDSQES